MRGLAWIPPVLAVVLFILSVGYPLLMGVGILFSLPETTVQNQPLFQLLLTTGGWALGVTLGAMGLGWLPGRVLGSSIRRRGFLFLVTLILIPLCIPPFVLFYCWYQAWPADSWLFRWAAEQNAVPLLRQFMLFAALVGWSWPLVALCVAGSSANIPRERSEMMALDGAPFYFRWLDAFRVDLRGLLTGGFVVFLLVFTNTTSFDLAQVFSIGNELRALRALGADQAQIMQVALPGVMVAIGGAGVVWWFLVKKQANTTIAIHVARPGLIALTLSGILWGVAILLPLFLFIVHLAGSGFIANRGGEFFQAHGLATMHSLEVAFFTGILAIILTVGLAFLWYSQHRSIRMLATMLSVGMFITALLPGTLVSVLFESAYNRVLFGIVSLDVEIYETPLILILGSIARYGFISALLGRWIVMAEPRSLADLRQLDNATTLSGMLISGSTRYMAGGGAAFCLVFALALSEVALTAQVQPIQFRVLTPTLLGAMHYRQPWTVVLGAGLLIGTAIVAAGITALLWGLIIRKQRNPKAIVLIFLMFLLPGVAGGCSEAESDPTSALNPIRTFGVAGNSLGQFHYPRGIAVDRLRGFVYVVDKEARVQRFDLLGTPQLEWRMPAKENGKPTGINVGPEGNIFVADTHYFRIIKYTPEGQELLRFGSYGEGPGQFIYTTSVAFGPEGTLYVSEYGGHDRIQVFDTEGQYLFEFGSFGEEEGEFNRPQAMQFNPEKTELYIADALNHRIVVTDPRGHWLRTFGTPGRGPGQLQYPYDLTLLDDGSLLISEFGGDRISHFTGQGQFINALGSTGRDERHLLNPWGVQVAGEETYVLDSGNNKVKVISTPKP